MGPAVFGFNRTVFSFETARELLKRSFFHDPNTLLLEAENENTAQPIADIMMDFTIALTNKNEEDALAQADRFISLYAAIRYSSSQVRDLYFNIW